MMFHTMRSCASEHVNVCAYRHPMNAACNKSVLAKVESSPCAWNGDALSRARVRMIFFCDNAIISQIRKKIVGQDNVCRLGYIGSYVLIVLAIVRIAGVLYGLLPSSYVHACMCTPCVHIR